jgi:methylglyoxal synthase
MVLVLHGVLEASESRAAQLVTPNVGLDQAAGTGTTACHTSPARHRHATIASFSKEGGSAGLVLRDPQANIVHDAEAVAALRLTTVAGLLVESGSTAVVLRDPLALAVPQTEVVAGRRYPAVAVFLKAGSSLKVGSLKAGGVGTSLHDADVVASLCRSVLAGSLEQRGSAGIVLGDPLACFVHDAEVVTARRMSTVAGLLVQGSSAGIVLGDPLASTVYEAEVVAALRIPTVAGLPELVGSGLVVGLSPTYLDAVPVCLVFRPSSGHLPVVAVEEVQGEPGDGRRVAPQAREDGPEDGRQQVIRNRRLDRIGAGAGQCGIARGEAKKTDVEVGVQIEYLESPVRLQRRFRRTVKRAVIARFRCPHREVEETVGGRSRHAKVEATQRLPTVAGLLVEADGAGEVPRDSLALIVHQPEVEAALRISAVAGLLVEAGGAGEVPSDARALTVHVPEVEAAPRISALAGLLVEASGAGEVLGNPRAILVQHAKVGTAARGSAAAGLLVEADGAGEVLGNPRAILVQHAKVGAALRLSAVAGLLVEAGSAAGVLFRYNTPRLAQPCAPPPSQACW